MSLVSLDPTSPVPFARPTDELDRFHSDAGSLTPGFGHRPKACLTFSTPALSSLICILQRNT